MSIATTVLAEQLMTLHTDDLNSTPYSEENFCGDDVSRRCEKALAT